MKTATEYLTAWKERELDEFGRLPSLTAQSAFLDGWKYGYQEGANQTVETLEAEAGKE